LNISVIIPVYNGRKYLKDCLDSIGSQTLLPDEVIVIDDASIDPPDNIVEIYAAITGYPKIRLLKLAVNQGQAAARNMGIIHSISDWIAFLDHDDIWDPDHLAEQKKTAIATNADLVFCQAKLFQGDPTTGFIRYAIPKLYNDELLEPLALMKNNFIITSSCLVRKSAMKDVGLFDTSPDMRNVEDLDMFIKMKLKNMKFAMSSQASLNYRKHDLSATGRLGHMIRNIVHVTEKHIKTIEGNRSLKNRLRCDIAWNAANETFYLKNNDRWFWLARAIYLTIIKLKRLDLYIHRFIKFQHKEFIQ
jgi:teichuronic acid biosynthesis glycosyltransferase TuaG